MMLLNRTAAAFNFTAEKLAGWHEIYFWTFTFKSVPIDDESAMRDWHFLHMRLRKHFPWLKGVRVCELHRSHGIHFHAIVNGRIPIRRVKEIAYGSGRVNGPGNRFGWNRYLDFGRMSVTRCDSGTIGYMAKYLTKEYRQDNNFGHRRRWGTIGGFPGTRCADVEYDTPFQRNKPLLFGQQKIDYATAMLLAHYSALWGDLEGWPGEHKMRVINFQTKSRDSRSEAYLRKPLNERIDKDANIWNGHLEMCGQCRCGHALCKRGLELWHNFIFAKEWVYKQGPPPGVTGCNQTGEATLSEAEERGSEKILENGGRQNLPRGLTGEKTAAGAKVYVLRPFNELQTVTETWQAVAECPF